MLQIAAAADTVHGTRWNGPIRGGFDDGYDSSSGIVLLIFDEFNLDHVARRDERHENGFPVELPDPFPARHQLFNPNLDSICISRHEVILLKLPFRVNPLREQLPYREPALISTTQRWAVSL